MGHPRSSSLYSLLYLYLYRLSLLRIVLQPAPYPAASPILHLVLLIFLHSLSLSLCISYFSKTPLSTFPIYLLFYFPLIFLSVSHGQPYQRPLQSPGTQYPFLHPLPMPHTLYRNSLIIVSVLLPSTNPPCPLFINPSLFRCSVSSF